MPRIDYYLKSLERFGANAVVLASGANVTLRFPTGDRYASQTTSHAELVSLVEEVATPAVSSSLRQGKPASVPVDCTGRAYCLNVEMEGPHWRVTITAGTGVAIAAAAAAPAVNTVAIGAVVGRRVTKTGFPPTGGVVERSAAAATQQASVGPRLTAVRTPPQPLLSVKPSPQATSTATVPRPPTRPEVPAVRPVQQAARRELTPSTAPSPTPSRVEATSRDYGRIVDRMLVQMHAAGASDLHLSSGAAPSIRMDGAIRPLEGFPVVTAQDLLVQLLEVTPEKNRHEFEERNDTDFAHMLPGVARFRANLFQDRHGPGAVFRAIPFRILSPDELGLPPRVLDLCDLTKGLVVVTGPTGSGKSTTLASLVDHVNRTRDDHIITVEDPIEFLHDSKRCLVHQREVHSHTRSFKDALRAALREDPDIVLVGEMRDLETVAVAIETAETGHLVFGTLHTNTAPSTVDRIIDQFPTDRQDQIRQMLAESLRGVIAQTLCKKIGGGRVAAYEVLMGSSGVSNLIRERKTFQLWSLMQTGRAQGMLTLNDSLMELVKKGLVEPHEAYRKAVNKAEIKTAFAREGIKLEECE